MQALCGITDEKLEEVEGGKQRGCTRYLSRSSLTHLAGDEGGADVKLWLPSVDHS